ncbi:hypothetical protein ABZ370_40725 [Streptomyces sp. NPDC005962]|uniref:hypothetical protein n=1 Tax=Streptomyces sp. NPDC005962 TaxID=3154466 RepID=UPI00340A898E
MTNPNDPRRDEQDHDLRTQMLLLALVLILLFAGGSAYVAYQHPALADPLTVGVATAAVLVAVFIRR